MLVGCGGNDDAPKDVDTAEPEECLDTWENWTEGFLRTWCTSCHSSQLPAGRDPDLRYGAPQGSDFDVYGVVVANAVSIQAFATGDSPTMPPVGGPDASDRQRLVDWITCGMPGLGEVEPDPCADGVSSVSGPVRLGGQADADALCADGGVAIEGDLLVDEGAVAECLCRVDGELRISGGETSFPRLGEVGGDLVVEGGAEAFDVPRLHTVGADVSVVSVPALAAVRLSSLVDVGGSVMIERLDQADRVDLSRLRTVAGDLRLSSLPRFRSLIGDAGALHSVGGAIVLSDLDDWTGFYAFDWLTSAGSVEVRDNDRITLVKGFNLLTSVGDVTIVDNDNLVLFDGFGQLTLMQGGLTLRDNPRLEREGALDLIERIDGDVVVRGNMGLQDLGGLRVVQEVGSLHIEDNSRLEQLVDLALTRVHGDLWIEDNGALTTMSGWDALQQVDGDLGLVDLPELDALPTLQLSAVPGTLALRELGVDALAGLGGLTTVGALQIVDNADLADVTALHGLTEVTGDVAVTGNPSLPGAAATELVAAIETIGGSTEVAENGP
ncbi:MAG: hypothetical protein KTR31_02285 [Myxococcales bacterium]|nr:hypothetical protein [Myxococcales bacterium]